MYLVKIINNGIETYINTISTSPDSPRISGQIKFGINTIDSFQFNILPNNIGYNQLHALTTLIEVINTKTNKIEFKGRVLLPKHIMKDTGLLTKTVVCECELGYLMDSTQRYGEYHNVTVKQFLEIIIDNHNKQVSEDKKFTVGVVDVVDSNNSLYRFLGYEKTFDTIKDKLIDRLGGELRIRYSNGVRYLDYLQEIGYTSSTEIRLSKNLKSIEEERDPTHIITRLVPLGAKIKKTEVDEEGNETEIETEERLTISSINNELDYIDDIEAMSKFGIIEDSETWDDITLPENLLRKGKELLKSNNRIKKKYSISALDLSLIGLDLDNIDIYNYYRVINPLMNIDEYLRVVEKTIDIESPQNSSINVGDKFEDIKQYQLSIMKTATKVKEVAEKINNTISTVNGIKDNIVTIGGTIGNLDNALNGNIDNVEEVVNLVTVLSNIVTNNTERIDSVETDISIIKNDISIIKTKLDKIDTLDTKLDTILEILQTPTE